MTQELTTQETSNPFLRYARKINQRLIVGEILKFQKGDYVFGANDKAIPLGTKLTANVDELLIGWTRWSDGKPADHNVGYVKEDFVPPLRNTLGDTDKSMWEYDDNGNPRDPWQQTNYLPMLHEGKGTLFTFATSSGGGLNAIAKLCEVYGVVGRQHPNSFPVIELRGDSYAHKNKARGRIKIPVFPVVGWSPKAAFKEALAAVVADEVDESESEVEEVKRVPVEIDDDIPF
jgi:hypothetical protein